MPTIPRELRKRTLQIGHSAIEQARTKHAEPDLFDVPSRSDLGRGITFLEFLAIRLMGSPASYASTDSFKWHCPFHDDENPSFGMYAPKDCEKDRFKCWGCETWGDSADLMKHFYPHESYDPRMQRIARWYTEYERYCKKNDFLPYRGVKFAIGVNTVEDFKASYSTSSTSSPLSGSGKGSTKRRKSKRSVDDAIDDLAYYLMSKGWSKAVPVMQVALRACAEFGCDPRAMADALDDKLAEHLQAKEQLAKSQAKAMRRLHHE